jgi:putative endonuclease
MHYVYILKCSNNDLYKGSTADLKARYLRHIKGEVPATANFLPVELVFYCAFKNKYKAIEFEKYLKSGSGRAFINRHLVSD